MTPGKIIMNRTVMLLQLITGCVCNTVILFPSAFAPDHIAPIIKSGVEDKFRFYSGTCSSNALNYLQLDTNHSRIDGHFSTSNKRALDINSVTKSLPNVTCPFAFDWTNVAQRYSILLDFAIMDWPWKCLIQEKFVCDSTAECLTDECGCGEDKTELFFCATQPGCIPFSQLCDGVADCTDQSDECLCEGAIEVHCTGQKSPTCLLEWQYCSYRTLYYTNCTINRDIDCGEIAKVTALEECLELLEEIVKNQGMHGRWDLDLRKKLIDQSSTMCSSEIPSYDPQEWEIYLQGINYRFGGHSLVPKFNCEFQSIIQGEKLLDGAEIPIKSICDGAFDCMNAVDERFCPGRFICDQNMTSPFDWINISRKCDNVKDCSHGRDECEGCTFGPLSSDQMLLRSKPIILTTLVACLAMIILNARQFYFVWTSVSESNISTVDKILKLQINAYDFLMGIYLGCILTAAFYIRIQHGPFCLFDNAWRSSTFCDVTGALFSVSVHGSLITVSLMSIIRCLQCCVLFICIPVNVVIGTNILIAIVISVNAFIPILKVSAVQTIFRSAIFFNDPGANPFADDFSRSFDHVDRIYETFYPATPTTDTYEKLRKIRNVTNKPEIFDYTEIGYYGNNRLCIQNIFKNQVINSEKLMLCGYLLFRDVHILRNHRGGGRGLKMITLHVIV